MKKSLADRIIETIETHPELCKVGSYVFRIGKINLWIANGCEYLEPYNCKIPEDLFTFWERRKIWKSYKMWLKYDWHFEINEENMEDARQADKVAKAIRDGKEKTYSSEDVRRLIEEE
ncbi:MAG: hypothetical protein V3U78_04460 [Thiotrichaceae bacterium]